MTERQYTHVENFVRSDPMGYVFSYLGAQDQGSLRSSARIFLVAFGAAVDAQIHIGRSANKEKIHKLEDIGTLPVGSWFPVSEKRCKEAPEGSKDQQLGTLVVNPRMLFNGAQLLPDGFLEGCVAQSIVYAQADHINSVGKRWMAHSERLTSATFEGLTALTTVGNLWLYRCTRLTSTSFEGLTALTTVDGCWLSECTSLTSATFDGLTALTTVGDNWLYACKSLTSATFEGLTALTTVGNLWLYRCTRLTSARLCQCNALRDVLHSTVDEKQTDA